MADVGRWVTAAEHAFPWQPGAFLKAFAGNQHSRQRPCPEDSPLTDPLQLLSTTGGYEGTASDLLKRLAWIASDQATRSRSWPSSPRGLSAALRRLAPNLRQAGVHVDFTRATDRRRTRLITVQPVWARRPSAPSATSNSPCTAGEHRRTKTRTITQCQRTITPTLPASAPPHAPGLLRTRRTVRTQPAPTRGPPSPGDQGPNGYLSFVRASYRAGHLTRNEWLSRVWLHGRVLDATTPGGERAVLAALAQLRATPTPAVTGQPPPRPPPIRLGDRGRERGLRHLPPPRDTQRIDHDDARNSLPSSRSESGPAIRRSCPARPRAPYTVGVPVAMAIARVSASITLL